MLSSSAYTMIKDEPVQILIDAPRLPDSIVSDWDSILPPSSGSSGTIAKFDCSHHLYVFYENIDSISHGCMDLTANPVPTDLSGYVYGFSYWLIYELVW